ncbi:MAG: hypothetical protein ACRD1Z_12210, partial [Vicinamibacteria bacterium]
QAAIAASREVPRLLRISAGNYGGRVDKLHLPAPRETAAARLSPLALACGTGAASRDWGRGRPCSPAGRPRPSFVSLAR